MPAPAAASPAEFKVTLATPEASVKEVAAGVSVARAASVLKVTTELAMGAPAASFKVAFTVAGDPLVIEVVAVPKASVSASVRVGVGVVPLPVPVPVPVPVPPPVPDVEPVLEGVSDPPLQPASRPTVAARKSDADNLEIFRLKEFRVK